jgi:Tol biopolymer transport system component/DNA-binding winged helix-turn-helix (wHTH) protein
MKKDEQIRRFYDFGEFRLDTNNRRLTGENGEAISLTPREFELLLALILNAGEVISKDALLQMIWTDAFVAEETLTRNVSFLRKKLGGGQFIETVPKIGYRFAADVRVSDLPEIVIEEKTLTRVRAEEIVSFSDNGQIAEVKLSADLPALQNQSSTKSDALTIPKSQIRNHKIFWVAAVLIVAALGGFFIYQFYFQKHETKIVFASSPVPFSSLPGYESMPSFSPDSRQIVFAWNGGEGEILDIYVKIVGTAGESIRLTRGDRNAMFPVFTPDGKYVAFFRSYPEASKIYQIPALGGAERKIAEVSSGGTSFSFSPDGKTIAVADRENENDTTGIFLINIETGDKQRLTTPPENFNDHSPHFSPDGKQIAFIRASGWEDQDLFTASADVSQTPQRLTFDRSTLSGLAWTADGKHIVFSSKRGGASSNLWQVAAAGGDIELVMTGGKNPFVPAIAPDGKTLAFVEQAQDVNIWRYEIDSNGKLVRQPRKFLASRRAEHSPVLSPDGKKLAFVSDRTGEDGIWIADADGSNLMNLAASGIAPRFSPDGKRLAYAAKNASDAYTSVFVTSIEGGAPRRLTDGSTEDGSPAWSADGRWIYFRSNRGGAMNIWKIPSDDGGEAIQITRNGGFETFAAPNGKEIYYTKEQDASGIWRVSTDGGEETPVPELSEAGQKRYWTHTPKGIYYLAPATQPPYKIMFYDFNSRQTREILTTDQPPLLRSSGLSVSADGKAIFYVQQDQNASNIMLTKL